jgi:hypothetical protein
MLDEQGMRQQQKWGKNTKDEHGDEGELLACVPSISLMVID